MPIDVAFEPLFRHIERNRRRWGVAYGRDIDMTPYDDSNQKTEAINPSELNGDSQRPSQAEAEEQVKTACEKLLANQIMEQFEFRVEAVEAVA